MLTSFEVNKRGPSLLRVLSRSAHWHTFVRHFNRLGGEVKLPSLCAHQRLGSLMTQNTLVCKGASLSHVDWLRA